MSQTIETIVDRLAEWVDDMDMFIHVRGKKFNSTGQIRFVISSGDVSELELVFWSLSDESIINLSSDGNVINMNLHFPSVPPKISREQLEDIVETVVHSNGFSTGTVWAEERDDGRLVAEFGFEFAGNRSFEDVFPEIQEMCQEYRNEMEQVLNKC